MNNLTCTNCTTSPWTHTPHLSVTETITYERVIQIALHTFIFVAGLLGNLFVVTVILRRKKMRTVTNWFVFNLAVSDLAIVLLVITTTNSIPFFDWPFGEIACRYLITPVLEHFAGVCVLTHTALSVARYVIVQHSMKGKTINLTHVKIIIALIWIVAFMTMSATLMGLFGECSLARNDYTGLLQCRVKWINRHRQLVYRIIIFSMTYVVPMIATGFAYVKIYVTVSKSIKALKGHTSKEVLSKRRRKSRRMNRVLMTMYVMFGITTLPLQLLYFLSDLHLILYSPTLGYIWLLFVALFYAQVVSNPFVLFYMGEDYRKELYKLPICCCFTAKHLRRMSSVFQSSLKERLNKRRSATSVKYNDRDSLNSKTGLVNEKRISTPIGSKKSNDTLFLNGYQGFNHTTQSTADIQTETAKKEEQLPVTSTNQASNISIVPNGLMNLCTNSNNTQQNMAFYECLSYSLEKEKRCQLEGDDLQPLTTDNRVEGDMFSTTNFKNKKLDFREKDLNSTKNTQSQPLFDDSDNLMQSHDSMTAYYDDGTLLYVFDPNIGTICFGRDSGRETII